MTTSAQDSIVLLGDSITQDGWSPYGFAQRLASEYLPVVCLCTASLTMRFNTVDDYVRKLDVINRGMSGYNTDWIIPVFEQVCTSHTPPS